MLGSTTVSKYHAEQLCEFYHARFGMAVSILRYSKIYGPGLEEGVVYELTRKALSNLPIEIHGNISTDFVFIDDIVNANLASFEFEIYNIGSGQESSLLNLCSMIIEFTKSTSKMKYSKEPIGHLSLDISKAKRDLNYEPKQLEDGLITYINYIRKHLQ